MADYGTREHVLVAEVGHRFSPRDLTDMVVAHQTVARVEAHVYQDCGDDVWRWLTGWVRNLRVEGPCLYADMVDLEFLVMLPGKSGIKEAGAHIERGVIWGTGNLPVVLDHLVMHEKEPAHG